LSTLLKRFWSWLTRKRKLPPEKVGYWHGLCPLCGEHIGIDILKNVITRRISATCPCCHQDIYAKIKE